MALISIILTTYNRKELVTETINSILSQSFQDFELIIVDNFSNYDFFSLIELFNSSKIKAFQNDNEGIIAVNRNFGIKNSTGKFLAFCDDDDLWNVDKLEKQLIVYNKNSKEFTKLVIHSNTLLFKTNTESYRKTRKSEIKDFNDFILNNQISLSTSFVEKNDDIFFNENPGLVASEDFNLWVELYMKGYKFILIEEALVKYRVSNSSISSNKREFNSIRYLLVIFRNIAKFNYTEFNFLFFIFKINLLALKYFLINRFFKVNN